MILGISESCYYLAFLTSFCPISYEVVTGLNVILAYILDILSPIVLFVNSGTRLR